MQVNHVAFSRPINTHAEFEMPTLNRQRNAVRYLRWSTTNYAAQFPVYDGRLTRLLTLEVRAQRTPKAAQRIQEKEILRDEGHYPLDHQDRDFTPLNVWSVISTG